VTLSQPCTNNAESDKRTLQIHKPIRFPFT
jgi:hypothetical protein